MLVFLLGILLVCAFAHCWLKRNAINRLKREARKAAQASRASRSLQEESENNANPELGKSVELNTGTQVQFLTQQDALYGSDENEFAK